MDTNLLIERFNILPENLQIQVSDYIEFLANKYLESYKTIKSQLPLSAETMQVLEESWNNYLKSPTKVKTWEELENEIIQEHGYEL